MDRMIRNVDPLVYRRFKAHAAAEGRTLGEVITEAMSRYMAGRARPRRPKKQRYSIADLPVFDGGPGSENWSMEIDEVLYGGDP